MVVSIRENIIESIRTLINPIQLISKYEFLVHEDESYFFMEGVGEHDYKGSSSKNNNLKSQI